jgi:hypothetical protein
MEQPPFLADIGEPWNATRRVDPGSFKINLPKKISIIP